MHATSQDCHSNKAHYLIPERYLLVLNLVHQHTFNNTRLFIAQSFQLVLFNTLVNMGSLAGLMALNPPPKSNNCVRVRMVDTTSIMSLHAAGFVKPVMKGHERMSVITMAFLIENEALGKKAMFDLGTRKDYWNCPPMTLQRILDALPGVKIDKDVTEILVEGGMPLEKISKCLRFYIYEYELKMLEKRRYYLESLPLGSYGFPQTLPAFYKFMLRQRNRGVPSLSGESCVKSPSR